MGSPCLTLVQNVASWLSIPIPSAVFSSTDSQVVQLRTLMNEEGEALRRWPDHYWNKLVRETSFVTLATNLQAPMPTDFDHMCNQTIWNRTMNRPVWGPMDGEQWQQELAGPTFSSPYYAFRIRGGQMLLTPIPAAGNSVFYEYVSSLWVYATGGTTPTKSTFTADDDTCVFADVIVERGIRWRFLRANGLDYAQEYEMWAQSVAVEIGRDGAAQRLNVSEKYPWNRRTPFIPQGNWNIP